MRFFYLLAVVLLTGCVQNSVAQTDEAVAPQERKQTIYFQGAEKILSMQNVSRVTLELVNSKTPTCRVNVTLPGAILVGKAHANCEDALKELIARTAPKEVPE